jgi:hypothetical protein
VSEVYLSLEVPGDRLLLAIADEAALADSDLDELERRLLEGALPPEEQAALALTVARAGRAESGWALAEVRRRLASAQAELPAQAVALAVDLLAVPPPPRVERADSGYRYTDPATQTVLFLEDPIAAHWHQRGAWGPPLRPDPARPSWALRGAGQIDAAWSRLAQGDPVVVTFEPPRIGPPAAPLRLVLAGAARDPGLALTVRWSQVLSIGTMERGRRRSVAFELKGTPRVALPARPAVPEAELIALLSRLVEHAKR